MIAYTSGKFQGTPPHVPTQRVNATPPARYVLKLLCETCDSGFYLQAPAALPCACPTCDLGTLRRVGSWDLVTQRWPERLP